jgi:hypothetical protein
MALRSLVSRWHKLAWTLKRQSMLLNHLNKALDSKLYPLLAESPQKRE